jgi:hypothetical protein
MFFISEPTCCCRDDSKGRRRRPRFCIYRRASTPVCFIKTNIQARIVPSRTSPARRVRRTEDGGQRTEDGGRGSEEGGRHVGWVLNPRADGLQPPAECLKPKRPCQTADHVIARSGATRQSQPHSAAKPQRPSRCADRDSTFWSPGDGVHFRRRQGGTLGGPVVPRDRPHL